MSVGVLEKIALGGYPMQTTVRCLLLREFWLTAQFARMHLKRRVTRMAEYIDRDAIYKAFANACTDVLERASEIDYIAGFSDELVIEILDNIPAADVAPVVRCKDCKWFANNSGVEWFGCWLFNAIKAVPEDAPTPDDFCSYADRKDDNATWQQR